MGVNELCMWGKKEVNVQARPHPRACRGNILGAFISSTLLYIAWRKASPKTYVYVYESACLSAGYKCTHTHTHTHTYTHARTQALQDKESFSTWVYGYLWHLLGQRHVHNWNPKAFVNLVSKHRHIGMFLHDANKETMCILFIGTQCARAF